MYWKKNHVSELQKQFVSRNLILDNPGTNTQKYISKQIYMYNFLALYSNFPRAYIIALSTAMSARSQTSRWQNQYVHFI